MSVIIKNNENRPVSLRLNSTRTLHIGPNAASTEIVDVEVNNNSNVQRLLENKKGTDLFFDFKLPQVLRSHLLKTSLGCVEM